MWSGGQISTRDLLHHRELLLPQGAGGTASVHVRCSLLSSCSQGQHEKAVINFQRALKVDKRCLSAWTLMGHEYVELRNTSAAVQCYRHAVDVDSGDYRAWYGLGQTYEMLHLHQYSLYYYRRAASLRPTDARMWCAVGGSPRWHRARWDWCGVA